jgi:hypothetical protein
MSTTWIDDKESLEARISSGEPRPEGVTELPIEEIEVVESVFQHRSGNAAASHKHLETLSKSVRKQKSLRFDPVTVFWVGDGWVLVDGHHRYDAYQEAKVTEPIPVRVFSGSLDEAINEALRGNSRDKLSMNPREKSEAAWKLVVGTNLRVFQIVESSTRTKPTIIKMKKIKEELQEKCPGKDLAEISWVNAQRIHKGLDPLNSPGSDEWHNQKVQKNLKLFVKTFGDTFRGQADILWEVLDLYDSRLLDDLLERYGGSLESVMNLAPTLQQLC